MKLALKWFFPVALTAMGLAWISEQVALFFGIDPQPQILVKLFTDPDVPWATKAKLAVFAVAVAPVLEEFVFRMGLFNFCRWIGAKIRKISFSQAGATFPMVSALVSGAVFAVVHFHAVTFVPLWFLGVAFAWLYWKAHSIRSSMLCHFLFNAVNLVFCLIFGGEI